MEKFNLSVENKNNIARKVKQKITSDLKHSEYTELDVFYNTITCTFFIDNFGDRAKLENIGHCFYKHLEWYSSDKKPTIKDLKELIFN